MIKHIPNIIKLILLTFLFSCSKEIDIPFDEGYQKMVLNSLFSPNEPISINISTSMNILANSESNQLFQKKYNLYENDSLIFSKTTLSDNISGPFPSEGKIYRITVETEEYGNIVAIDTCPKKVLITEAKIEMPIGFDEFGMPISQANITFEDPVNECNYYELIIYQKQGDEIVYCTELSSNDEIIINEGDSDYLPTTIFFSDKIKNGETITLHIKLNLSFIQENGEYLPNETFVILRSISQNYYSYRKYWTRHFYNQNKLGDPLDVLFLGEPIEMYTNIENGFGIFAGYSEHIVQFPN